MKNVKQYLLVFCLLAALAVEAPIITVGLFSKPEPGDVIIVLGAKLIGSDPSTMLRLRLDEALKLYGQGYGPTIIVSGAQGHDESISEAAAMRKYLIQNGVPEKNILTEDQSFNTYQNLSNSKKIMRQHGLNKAIIVSNASHIRRSLLLARELELPASAAPAPMADNPYLLVKQYIREGAAMLFLPFSHHDAI